MHFLMHNTYSILLIYIFFFFHLDKTLFPFDQKKRKISHVPLQYLEPPPHPPSVESNDIFQALYFPFYQHFWGKLAFSETIKPTNWEYIYGKGGGRKVKQDVGGGKEQVYLWQGRGKEAKTRCRRREVTRCRRREGTNIFIAREGEGR